VRSVIEAETRLFISAKETGKELEKFRVKMCNEFITRFLIKNPSEGEAA
jgi:hypothetical protein